MKKELSNIHTNFVEVNPGHLLCIRCMNGGGELPFMKEKGLDKLWERIFSDPDIHVKLKGAFDEVGARMAEFWEQTPEERKRDLDVIQRLGLTMVDTRTARDLYALIDKRIGSICEICCYEDHEGSKWTQCPLADKEYYEKGSKSKLEYRKPDVMKKDKESSCKMINESDHIVIRAHHLLCTTCFIGGENNELPLEVDNLYEMWVKMRENPQIEVELIEGPGDCMVCPPCHAFIPERGVCDAACHLRDRKKDLDTFMVLGLKPGDRIKAVDLVKRIAERIPETAKICAYNETTSPEWNNCGSAYSGRYEKGLKILLKSMGIGEV